MQARRLPRAAAYPLLGALLATGLLVGLPLIRAAEAGRSPTFAWVRSDIAQSIASYAYVAWSSFALVMVLGFLFGRRFDRAQFLSITDPLTGLYNRRYFGERLTAEMSRARRHGSHTCVLCLDVDRLKAINDGFGHGAGDRALIALAQTVTMNLRPTDVFARFGGDEFVVLLPQTGSAEARRLSARLLGEVSRHHGTRVEHFEMSIGIAELGPTASSEEVLAAADAALYRAKAAGGGKAVFNEESELPRVSPPLPPLSSLRRLLRQD